VSRIDVLQDDSFVSRFDVLQEKSFVSRIDVLQDESLCLVLMFCRRNLLLKQLHTVLTVGQLQATI